MQTIPSADVSAVSDGVSRAVSARRILSTRSYYRPRCSAVRYSDSERTIAQNLALENFGELSHLPVRERDERFLSDGSSQVSRYLFEDGTVGYFKPFGENSFDEYDFRDYGTSSLGASINEVNAYRMAQLLGGCFAELVPETVLREIEGSLGSLQREVISELQPQTSYYRNPQLREDYRKAAIFDFVIGNLDRHSDNYIYGLELTASGRKRFRIRLIDNSFSFPWGRSSFSFNSSIFAENSAPGGYYDPVGYRVPGKERKLRVDERAALENASAGVERWMAGKTIGFRRGQAVLKRINFLLEGNQLINLSDYLYEH